MIRVLYFASLRERVGVASEELPVIAIGDAATVAGLRAHLIARGGAWAGTLTDGERMMVAVNQELARPETLLRDGDEVAFFPPVTGG